MTRTARRAALGALALAVLAAVALHPQLARGARRLVEGSTRPVVVLARDLARGEPISRATLDFRDLPERYLEERHIEAHDIERVLGARAASYVPTGSALLWSDLDLAVEGRTLAGLVRAGKRAYTLPAGDLGFTGLLRPGDRVDVLFTRADGSTVTLLQNVLVLTAGSELWAAREAGDPHALAEVVAVPRASEHASERLALSVDLEQAQQLAASEGRGALRLALRNPADVALVELPTSTAYAGGPAFSQPGEQAGAP